MYSLTEQSTSGRTDNRPSCAPPVSCNRHGLVPIICSLWVPTASWCRIKNWQLSSFSHPRIRKFWTIGSIYWRMYSSAPELIEFISTLWWYFLYFSCTLLGWRINWGRHVHSMYCLHLCIRNVIPYLHSIHFYHALPKDIKVSVLFSRKIEIEIDFYVCTMQEQRNSELAEEIFILKSFIKFKEKTYFFENMT